MTVASVTEISAVSERSFEDAIRTAVDCATETLRGVEGWWVKDQNVTIEDGSITGYRVNLEVTFLLEEAAQGSAHGATGETPQTGRTVPVEERPEAGAPEPASNIYRLATARCLVLFGATLAYAGQAPQPSRWRRNESGGSTIAHMAGTRHP